MALPIPGWDFLVVGDATWSVLSFKRRHSFALGSLRFLEQVRDSRLGTVPALVLLHAVASMVDANILITAGRVTLLVDAGDFNG